METHFRNKSRNDFSYNRYKTGFSRYPRKMEVDLI